MNKEILKLAIPNIISNISVPLLSTVDTLLMGRQSAAHLGAVGLGAMVFNFIYWNFGFLRMGTTGMTAQAFGRNNKTEIMSVLVRATLLSGFLALVIYIFRFPLFDLSCTLLNVRQDQITLIGDYFFIRLLAAPATLLLYVLMGWFFGMQNAVIPLVLTIAGNVVNIFFSAYLVQVRDLGIAGVAWGTVIAQYFGVGLAIIFLGWRYKALLKHIVWKTIMQWTEFLHFLNINKDLFIRTVGLTFAFGFFYSMSSSGGELILAANVVLLQFVNWMSYGIDGFAYASESIVGKYHGRRDKAQVNKAIRLSFFWALTFAALYAFLYWVLGDLLLTVFTDKPEIIAAAKDYLWWMILFPLFAFASYIWDGIYIGFTASKSMRNSMIVSLIIYLGVYYLTLQWGNHGLWLSLLSLMIARGLVQTYLYRKFGMDIK